MQIARALDNVEVLAGTGDTAEIAGVQYDSRRVEPGDVFVAMRGETTDGNRYIDAALSRGAKAVVTDSPEALQMLRTKWAGVPAFLVANGRRALAGVAANVFGHPERRLAISAVTGTNGKTTTAWLLEQMLRSVDRKCVLVGTIETHVADQVRVSEHTTPEASDLLRTFADGVAAGCTEAVMEMSSHALAQERVWGLPVDVAIFTNLTQDHLDFHGTMEAYFAAKARLFKGVGSPAPRVSILNADDPAGRRLREGSTSEVMTYGIDAGDFRAEEIALSAGNTRFRFHTPLGMVPVESSLTGRVNVYNLLAAACAGLARGLSLAQVAAAARSLRQAPGRFEVVPGSAAAGFTVVVDYAHTDDALTNLIALARDLAGSGRVITVFGCGGDRDKGKRPKMGRAAGAGSDFVVITTDNPRSEEPGTIVEEILAGVRTTRADFLVELDRAQAIELAIASARAGDILLIAGKGHEKVQVLRDGTVEFDDVAVAAGVLASYKRSGSER